MSSPDDTPPATRALEVEVEVPGTPDQVWEAVATGPGITAWFVPAEVDEREGGAISLHFGPGMDETGRVTAWEPPARFAYAAPVEGERRLDYEWLVEARSEGTCRVRLVTTGFGSGADWDAQYAGLEGGWKLFLFNLRLSLTHFPGQACTPILVNGTAAGSREEAWATLTGALGLPDSLAEGDEAVASAAGAPALSGRVERATGDMLTLLLDEPAPGVAFLAAEGSGEMVITSFYAYLFGDEAPAVADREEPLWRAWMERTFPPAPS